MFSFIKKLDSRSRAVLFTCYFAFFCNGSLALVIGSALPDLKEAYGVSDVVSGLFLSAHSIGNLVAGFIAAIVPLWLGEKKSIILLSSLGYLGFLMMIISGNPVWLFIAFILTGIVRGSVTNFSNRSVNRITDGNPSAMNCLHASFAVGAILSPMIFLAFSRGISWRAGLGFIVLCGGISALNFSRMRLTSDRPDRTEKSNRSFVFLKNPSYLILGAMMFCYLCSEYSINGWLVTYIQNKETVLASFGKSGEELTLAVEAYSQTMATLFWVLMLVGRLSCAVLSVKYPERKLLFICSVGVLVFFVMMLLAPNIAVATVAIAGLGLSMAGISPMIYSDSSEFSNVYPMAVSCLIVIGSVGSIMMNTVIGVLAEKFGFQGGMSAITVTVVLLMVFSFLNMTLKRRPVLSCPARDS